MTMHQKAWRDFEQLNTDDLKEKVFNLLQQTALEIQTRELDDPDVLATVPRLANLLKLRPDLACYTEAFNALARSVGLWNYIDREAADLRDAMVADAVTVKELDGIALHREQVTALNSLFAGRNLILSAPTSFGKSLLIDALLASGRYKRVAIVLPTIALLDEFRRRLNRRFAETFSIVMYHSEAAPTEENVIFLGTQERLLNRSDIGVLDLAVVDEFYKLDANRQDDRSATLNAAVYQLLRRSKQFFFLGPNIQAVRYDEDNRWKFEFLHTRFSTVAVDTFDVSKEKNKEGTLLKQLARTTNWPALVFASSPDRANQLSVSVASSSTFADLPEMAEWISDNFGAGWELIATVRKGVAVHHGRLPRSLAARFVRLFNDGLLPILICTSTLIEGVNTEAKSVLIYDKKIARKDYDFFTFSNISGRAGRLGEHHVGSVYLFNVPPKDTAVQVEPPLFGDLDTAPDELVVHISEADSSEIISDRVAELSKALNLTPNQLRLAASIGLDDASALHLGVTAALRSGTPLAWNGSPSFDNIFAVCRVICEVKKPSEFGVRSAKQLAMYLSRLRSAVRLRSFYQWHSGSYQGQPQQLDNVFRFMRACEYGLPQLFSVIEMFVQKIHPTCNYNLFVAELPRWFRDEVLKNLDEQGIPIQISERYFARGDTLQNLKSRLL